MIRKKKEKGKRSKGKRENRREKKRRRGENKPSKCLIGPLNLRFFLLGPSLFQYYPMLKKYYY